MKKLIYFLVFLLLPYYSFGQEAGKIGGTDKDAINKIGDVPVESISKIGNVSSPYYFKSCEEILLNNPGSPDGIYTIDPDGSGDIEPFDCYCDMSTDDGGWTLVTIHSDDSQDNWTYNNLALFYNDTYIGSTDQLNLDYKGQAMVQLNFSDVLFVHAPSGVWAAYHNVGNGSSSFGDHINTFPFPYCSTEPAGTMSAGTLSTDGTSLCSTGLFFNAGDWEGTSMSNCANLYRPFPYNEAAWGPVWSVENNSGCPFDDPGSHSSLGPNFQTKDTEQSAIGFGWAINGNTGISGTGENNMKVFVR